MMEPTLILPANNNKAKPQPGFEPTLLIADNHKALNNQHQKEKKSDIDRLLDSDDDSPRFGQKPAKKKPEKEVVSSSVEDIFDVLDGG